VVRAIEALWGVVVDGIRWVGDFLMGFAAWVWSQVWQGLTTLLAWSWELLWSLFPEDASDRLNNLNGLWSQFADVAGIAEYLFPLRASIIIIVSSYGVVALIRGLRWGISLIPTWITGAG
jgi:hypothetical protein